MHQDEILKYIETKNNYVQNDFKLHFIFEVLYFPGNRELYKKKMHSLERKMGEDVRMHTPYKIKNFLSKGFKNSFKSTHQSGVKIIHSASLLSGFSEADFGLVSRAYSDESKDEKVDDFIMAFEKLVSDPEAIPSNSVIILSQDQHHMERLKRKAEVSFTINEKKRKIAAKSKGQKSITDFFRSTKSSSSNKTQKSEEPTYKLEEIIKNKRGSDSNIKILWIPKSNDELNPGTYISVLFCKEVVSLLEGDENLDAIDACKEEINVFPSAAWWTIMKYVEKLEKAYEKESKSIDDESESSDREAENDEPNDINQETN
ncbi:unnamed protein product [Chironomus riparius]|uniref:Uncharacterized protein n=1 Tax=Chironomus riparius TaxID=315576 RepID=A0A9N9RP57_9DIPT|nr:unnamed protein product [Chironomus riparius]